MKLYNKIGSPDRQSRLFVEPKNAIKPGLHEQQKRIRFGEKNKSRHLLCG
jgi:hypothetical protein